MIGYKSFFLLCLTSWGLTLNSEYYLPATLANISIFTEIDKDDSIFHIFFIRGEFSFTDRSFQYRHSDDLQFTSTRLVKPTKDAPLTNMDELKNLLDFVVADHNEVKKIREKAQVSIRPFVFQLKSKGDDKSNEERDFMRLELMQAREIYTDYYTKQNSFTLFANHFSADGDRFIVETTPQDKHTVMDIFLEHSRDSVEVNEEDVYQYSPYVFSILKANFKDREETPGHYSKFDFRFKDGEWACPKLIEEASGNFMWENTKVSDGTSASEVLKHLKNLFSKTDEASTTTPKPVTNFISSYFDYLLTEAIKKDAAEIDKLNEILENSNPSTTSVLFENIKDDPLLEAEYRGKYNIFGELKKSFKDDVLLTSINPFTKDPYQPTVTKTSSSSSTTSNSSNVSSTAKKEGMSTGLMTLIIILVVVAVVVICGLGAYFVMKNKGKKNRKRM